VGGAIGLALLVFLALRSDLPAMLQALESGGWALLWLVPYRLLFFGCYAVGWFLLLAPYDRERRVSLGYVFWVTTVREGVDRLLPVASVGGGVVGIRLLHWRGIGISAASATVLVEILLTLISLYLFAVLGFLLLIDLHSAREDYSHIVLALLFTLPVPAGTALLLRYGSVFGRLQKLLRSLVGKDTMSHEATSLDEEVRANLRRGGTLFIAGALQFTAFLSGAFEVWFALRLFGHPVNVKAALVLESMSTAVRQVAFFVPAGLGVQEAGLVIFGHALGISSDLALAVSMAKRVREVLCGIPALLSWQWLEGRRLHRPMGSPS
jgi:putative membrane protein